MLVLRWWSYSTGTRDEPSVSKHRRSGLAAEQAAERFTVDADVDFRRALTLVVKGGPQPSEKAHVDLTDEREADQ